MLISEGDAAQGRCGERTRANDKVGSAQPSVKPEGRIQRCGNLGGGEAPRAGGEEGVLLGGLCRAGGGD